MAASQGERRREAKRIPKFSYSRWHQNPPTGVSGLWAAEALTSPCFLMPILSPAQQCNDVGLMTYLGTITKTCNTMNQFVNKFNILYDRQSIGRRMRGLFF